MRDRLTALIAIVLLAALAGSTYWYSRATRLAGMVNTVAPNAPDFVVQGVVLTHFDEQGRARNRLFAERMSHFVEDDRIELAQPRLVSLLPDQPQTETRARRGVIEGGGEKLTLHDDVVITRASGADGAPPMRLETSRLVALPDTERYTTDQPVRMQHGESTADAQSMDFDNLARTIKLGGRVSTVIQPAAEPRR